MWAGSVVLVCVLVFVLLVGGAAAYRALFAKTEAQAKRAYNVLQLVLRYGAGAGGLVAAANALHNAGLLK